MMNSRTPVSRRHALRTMAAGALAAETLRSAGIPSLRAGQDQTPQPSPAPKRVAGVVTVYHHNSHADVILGKILHGWKHSGGPGPSLELASLYVDQFPKNDLARKLAEDHGIPLCDSISEALTLGGKNLAVDGVLSIAEHGRYPYNEKGQHLYPRRRFFSEISETMSSCGQTVPVFNDKSLSTVWEDAKWVYDRARDLSIPLMAGSSLPVTYRKPDLHLPPDSSIEEIVGIGYGGLDSYGFHALECLQTFAERRRGGETGVDWVQSLTGQDMWDAVDRGDVSAELLDAALTHVPKTGRRPLRDLDPEKSALFRFRYRDGTRGSVFMLQGYAAGVSVACRLQGQRQPFALQIEERYEPRFPHFAFLLKGIEHMMHTGRPAWPVERTLLTAGILDRALNSRYKNGQKIRTPELKIDYAPSRFPYAPHLKLSTPVPV